MMKTSMLRRTYDGIALFAILNLLSIGGLVGLLISNGALSRKNLPKFAAIMRGADVAPTQEPAVDASAVDVPTEQAESLHFSPATAQMDLEVYRREADRIQEELRQRLALNNSILLRITTERQTFQRERDQAAKQAEAERRLQQTRGFEKQVAILASVKPSTAIEHLMSLEDPDEAAGILLAMNDRQAKKIVDAAKRPDQRKRMNQILQRLKEVSVNSAVSP